MVLHPPMTFRVGCIGHRPNRLTGADPALLSSVLGVLLTTIREEVFNSWGVDYSKWYSGKAPALQVVTSLAEGSDRLIAEEAMDLGYSVSCPMPFPQPEYEKDFAPPKALESDSLKHFRNILEQAEHSTGLTRFELIGDRDQEPESYKTCGQMVLNQSDLLLIIWDGISKNETGGSEDMLRRAIKLNIPLIWIDAQSPHNWMILDQEHHFPHPQINGRRIPVGRNDNQALIQIIKSNLVFPGEGDPTFKEEKSAYKRMADFYKERSPGWNPAILWRIFNNLLGNGIRRSTFTNNHQSGIIPSIQGFENRQNINEIIRSDFSRFDLLSNYYSDFYRSGYILTFLLAALAVGLALFPVAAGWLTHPNHTGESIMVIAELVTLLCILLLVFRSRSGRWHSRWLDYRLAAEWIRQLRQLAPLGLGVKVQEVRGHKKSYEHPSSSWMAWYVKNLERSLGLPNARIDKKYLEKYIDGLIELVKDQKAYHTLNAKRNHLITERLHHYGIMLVGATIAACFLHLLPVMIPKLHWPEGFSYLLTFLCGFMPALGASLAGINNQGEFKSMFKTSESMNHEYSLFYEELDRLKNSIQSCKEGADVHLFRRIKETAYHISFLMIEELSDWRITYSNRPLDLPT